MQEDVENRTINFAISTTKLTGRTILAAARKFLQWRAGKVHGKPVGKQSVKQLLRQDQGATNIEIEKPASGISSGFWTSTVWTTPLPKTMTIRRGIWFSSRRGMPIP